MCGRFLLDAPGATIATFFDADGAPASMPTFNAAPTQVLPVVLPRGANGSASGRRTLELLQWGLVPAWAAGKQPPMKPLINARAETAWDKPSFRKSMRSTRCVVPASGFYEWYKVAPEAGGGKQPVCFTVEGSSLFGFAGIHERSRAADGTWNDTFAILTTAANALVEPVHARMPVIMTSAGVDTWLDPDADREALEAVLAPFDAERMASWPVSRMVNDATRDGRELVQPIEA